jgi:hypothetical protein
MWIVSVCVVCASCTNDAPPDITPPTPQFVDSTQPPNPIEHRIYADVDPTKRAIWLEWTRDSTASTTGYQIYRSTDDTIGTDGLLKNGELVATLETTNDIQDQLPTEFRDTTDIQTGAAYYYQLRAFYRMPTGKVNYSAPTHVDISTSYRYEEPVVVVSPVSDVELPDVGLLFVWHDESWRNGGNFQVIVQRYDTKQYVWSEVISSFGSIIQAEYPRTSPELVPGVPYRWRVKRIDISRPGGYSSAWYSFQVH